MATSQAILAQALPAASPAASSGVFQRKPASTNLAAPSFKGSVAGLRWDSHGAIVQAKVRQFSVSLSSVLENGFEFAIDL